MQMDANPKSESATCMPALLEGERVLFHLAKCATAIPLVWRGQLLAEPPGETPTDADGQPRHGLGERANVDVRDRKRDEDSVLGDLVITNFAIHFQDIDDIFVGEFSSIPLLQIGHIEVYARGLLLQQRDSALSTAIYVPARSACDPMSIPDRLQEACRHAAEFCLLHESQSAAALSWDNANIWTPHVDLAAWGMTDDSIWRIDEANQSHALCSTYPAKCIMPAAYPPEFLSRVSAFRSRGRFPVLAWRNSEAPFNIILRASQPGSGMLGGGRCREDELLIRDFLRAAASQPAEQRRLYAEYDLHGSRIEEKIREAQSESLLQLNTRDADLFDTTPLSNVAGKFLVFDARPYVNAVANGVIGGGFENAEFYGVNSVDFLNIPNVHEVRDAFENLFKTISFEIGDKATNNCAGDLDSAETGDGGAKWFQIIEQILAGAVRMASAMATTKVSCLVHCTDGWDRTSQLVSLVQILLDPTCRTFQGFERLIQRDWISFGHRFIDRSGMPPLKKQKHPDGNRNGSGDFSSGNSSPPKSPSNSKQSIPVDDLRYLCREAGEQDWSTRLSEAMMTATSEAESPHHQQERVNSGGRSPNNFDSSPKNAATLMLHSNAIHDQHHHYHHQQLLHDADGDTTSKHRHKRTTHNHQSHQHHHRSHVHSLKNNNGAHHHARESHTGQQHANGPSFATERPHQTQSDYSAHDQQSTSRTQRQAQQQVHTPSPNTPTIPSVAAAAAAAAPPAPAPSSTYDYFVETFFKAPSSTSKSYVSKLTAYASAAVTKVVHKAVVVASAKATNTAPIFFQFLDCVRLLVRRFPSAFEFSEAYLAYLYQVAFSGRFSAFRFNCLGERTCHTCCNLNVGGNGMEPPCVHMSLWAHLAEPSLRKSHRNAHYDPGESVYLDMTLPTDPLMQWLRDRTPSTRDQSANARRRGGLGEKIWYEGLGVAKHSRRPTRSDLGYHSCESEPPAGNGADQFDPKMTTSEPQPHQAQSPSHMMDPTIDNRNAAASIQVSTLMAEEDSLRQSDGSWSLAESFDKRSSNGLRLSSHWEAVQISHQHMENDSAVMVSSEAPTRRSLPFMERILSSRLQKLQSLRRRRYLRMGWTALKMNVACTIGLKLHMSNLNSEGGDGSDLLRHAFDLKPNGTVAHVVNRWQSAFSSLLGNGDRKGKASHSSTSTGATSWDPSSEKTETLPSTPSPSSSSSTFFNPGSVRNVGPHPVAAAAFASQPAGRGRSTSSSSDTTWVLLET